MSDDLHQDVYKRQAMSGADAVTPMMTLAQSLDLLFVELHVHLVPARSAQRARCLNSTPVSYTHLDVYKRQAFLGGPLQYLSELRHRFYLTLNLDEEHRIVPQNAHLFVASGAAMAHESNKLSTFPQLIEAIDALGDTQGCLLYTSASP